MTTSNENRRTADLPQSALHEDQPARIEGGEGEEKPYLILTMRRTGGTSLTSFLGKVSAFSSIQHEPFNKKRVWSTLKTEYVDRYDSEAFAEALNEVLGTRPNIKHCVELVPLELTTALVRACFDRGYRMFVLSRRNEAARLRSLFLAQATGVWGKRQADKIYPEIITGNVALPPVNLKMVKRRARIDGQAITAVRDFLHAQHIEYTELVFEDIYAKDGGLPARARVIAARLGIEVAPDNPALDRVMTSPNQASTEVFRLLPNAAEFEAALEAIENRAKERLAR